MEREPVPDTRAARVAAELLASGLSASQALDALMAEGYGETDASEAIGVSFRNPLTQLLAEYRYKWQKTQSLLELLVAPTPGVVRAEPVTLAAASFDQFEALASANRAIYLSDVASDWPAMSTWTIAAMRRRFGDVSVVAAYDAGGTYGDAAATTYTAMNFGQFLDRLESGDPHFYLTARSGLTSGPLADLLKDVRPIPGVNDKNYSDTPSPSIWIGAAGTLSPLHHDNRGALLVQIAGSKRVALVPPEMAGHVDDGPYCFSSKRGSPEDLVMDLGRMNVHASLVSLEAGSAIFIPVGWWHAVEAQDTSMSVTFWNTNGDRRWEQPYLGEDSQRLRVNPGNRAQKLNLLGRFRLPSLVQDEELR